MDIMRKRQLSIIFLILAITGCSSPTGQYPSQTEVREQVNLSPTLTPELDFTSTFTPLPEASYTPTPTNTPAPATTKPIISKPAAIIARVEGGVNSFILVGGTKNGNWISAAEVAEIADFDTEYQLYTAFEFQDWITGQKPEHEPICDQHFVSINQISTNQSAFGITGEWSVLPRTPLEQSPDTEIYLQAVAAWQVEQAPSQPIAAVKKIWRVDVEGDGTDEVFINATRFAEPTGHNVEPRDYSVVLMRTVIGSDVATVELVGDYYSEPVMNQFPLAYNLEFIGDLNGDGQMEVVVGVSRWEGSGVMVFEIDGADVQLVLSVMCSQ